MPSREEKSRIDAQWQHLQPGWGPKEYHGERQMLYDNLDEGESIERLWSCGWKVFEEEEAMESHDRGIIVATRGRVLLMNRGRLRKNVSAIPYSSMAVVEEAETGKVRIRKADLEYDLAVELWAPDLVSFLQERILSGAASMETELSRVLENGELLERWAHCTAGEEWVLEVRPRGYESRGPDYDYTFAYGSSALAVATDRRILFYQPDYGKMTASWPHGTILAVEYWGGTRVRFAAVDSPVSALRFTQEEDAAHFASLMRQHTANAARRVSAETRISAHWKLQHPLWHHRDNHGSERRKLAEVMEEDEHIEALAWGEYQPLSARGELHSGIIAATGQRLLFVSNGLMDKHVSELPYDGVNGLDLERGKLVIHPAPGYDECEISSIDDMSPHDSRHKGHSAVFETRFRVLLETARQQGAAFGAAPLAGAKRLRVDARWTERSDDWNLGNYSNEREMFYEVLQDDEDIECLIEGLYNKNVQGASGSWGVIAATDRRVVYVYNGLFGAVVAELPYGDIESVNMKGGLLSSKISITARLGVNGWEIDNVFGNMDEFADCVRNHVRP